LYMWILVLFLVYYRKILSRSDRLVITGFFSFTVVLTILQGSRAGLLTLFLLFVFARIIVKGNFFIRKKAFYFFCAISFIIGPLIWVSGSAVRSGSSFSFSGVSWTDTLLNISKRLGNNTDNFIVVINDWTDRDFWDRFVTMRMIVKMGLNGFVPGDIFSGLPFESLGNLWSNLAWGYFIPYHGEGWMIVGQFYLFYGYTIALLLTFFWVYFGTRLFIFFWRRHSFFSVLVASQVFALFFYSFFDGQNLDAMVTSALLMGSYLVILHIVLSFIHSLPMRTVKRRISEKDFFYEAERPLV